MQNRLGRFDATSFQEIILSSGVFRRETASGFYPWSKVEGPRKRVAEWLCGWRHGNSFPMTQSAQSHRQMRSIPLCSKAVFYVFVFDSIHDSTTLHNLSPAIFHWAALIRSYGASFACMELTIISRFQRLIKNWFGLFLRFFYGCWWSKCLIFNSIITHCVKIW